VDFFLAGNRFLQSALAELINSQPVTCNLNF